MNRVTVIAFLGADDETKSTNNGELAIHSLQDLMEKRRRRTGMLTESREVL